MKRTRHWPIRNGPLRRNSIRLKTEIHAARSPRPCQSRSGTAAMANAYDVVRYPNWPVPETHPATLGAFAALLGRRFAPFHACRVLEIGCGEGVNLMSMALGAPASEFVGIDLAEAPVAQGRATAEASGLANVTLRVQDIMQAGAALGEFDYIVAHGVYAWVPAPVRAALMRLVGKCLRTHGL